METPLEFITQLVGSRDTLTVGNYVSDDEKYKLSIHDTFEGASPSTMLRVHNVTGEVQLRAQILKLSEMSVAYWLIWGFIRNACNSPADADVKALPIMLAMYPSIKRSDLAQFYQEFNQQLALAPSPANVLRSEGLFELVSDQLVSGLSDSSIKPE